MTRFCFVFVFLVFAVDVLATESGSEAAPIRSAEETERLLKLAKSDVLISSRWKHPQNDKDPHDTMRAISEFHATRNEWCYADDPEFIGKVKSKVKTYAGTVNTLYRVGKKNDEKAYPGQVTSRDGNSVAAPWMIVFHGWWGCVNSKEFRDDYLGRLGRLLDGGVDSIHMDDPSLNLATLRWGGCFCPYCIEGFRSFLKEQALPQNVRIQIGDVDRWDVRSIGPDKPELWALFRDFQQESVRRFYVDMRKAIRNMAGREVLFSTNNYCGTWNFPSDSTDFGVAELNEKSATPLNLFQVVEEARRRGKIQIFTLSFRDVPKNRFIYALLYATGSHAILPWDVYITSDSPRLYLKPEEFADISGFVRSMAQYLDDYSTGLVSGGELNQLAQSSLMISGNDTLYALARSPKNGPDVVHLVQWGESGKSVLKLVPDHLWKGQRPQEVDIWTPVPYDAQLHKDAGQSGDYSRLAHSQRVPVRYANDGKAEIVIPPIDLWAIVTVP